MNYLYNNELLNLKMSSIFNKFFFHWKRCFQCCVWTMACTLGNFKQSS